MYLLVASRVPAEVDRRLYSIPVPVVLRIGAHGSGICDWRRRPAADCARTHAAPQQPQPGRQPAKPDSPPRAKQLLHGRPRSLGRWRLPNRVCRVPLSHAGDRMSGGGALATVRYVGQLVDGTKARCDAKPTCRHSSPSCPGTYDVQTLWVEANSTAAGSQAVHICGTWLFLICKQCERRFGSVWSGTNQGEVNTTALRMGLQHFGVHKARIRHRRA